MEESMGPEGFGKGRVYWVTGLAGAGKSTIGGALYKHIKQKKNNVVLLDGDIMREVFNNKGYSKNNRIELGLQYARLCNMLAKQGLDVVCCTIAMFKECYTWNEENIRNYKCIFLEVPFETLIERRPIYLKAMNEQIKDVVGVDIGYEIPNQRITIVNDGTRAISEIVNEIIVKVNIAERKSIL